MTVRIPYRTVLAVLALALAVPAVASASDYGHDRGRGRHHRDYDRGRHHDNYRRDYHRGRDHYRGKDYYRGHRRDYYRGYRGYRGRDVIVKIVPRGAVVIPFGGHRYRYHRSRGYFYRPIRSDFVVVAPPVGIIVPVLPAYYSTVVVRGVSYYRCDDAYYVWSDRDRGYRVVNAPEEYDEPRASGPAPQEIFAYPREGQNSERESGDRYACHSWAVDQTGFDPTQPLGGVAESEALEARSDYQRAVEACLDARGYSVR
jgi:hypothetical protein